MLPGPLTYESHTTTDRTIAPFERSTYERLDNARYTNAVRDTAPDRGSMKSAWHDRLQVSGIRVRTRVKRSFCFTGYYARAHSFGLITLG